VYIPFVDNITSFPPPTFLRMPGSGINISDHGIKVVRLRKEKTNYLPEMVNEYAIEDGVVEDGKIQESSAITEKMAMIHDRHDVRFVYLSIPEEHGYVFGLRIPAVQKESIHDTVAVRLAEHVPLSREDVVFGCDLVERIPEEQEMYVNVAALPKEIVDKYQNICLAADLIPLVFEIEAQSIQRAVMDPNDTAPTMIVDIGRTRTGLSIVNKGVIQYTATLNMGGDMFTEAVAKQRDKSFKEADLLKQERGFVRAGADNELHLALVNCVSVLVDEIRRRFDYWGSHAEKPGHTNQPIQKIILSGGNASVPGLSEHISRAVGVPVRLANVWKNAFSTDEYIPEVDFNHSLQYAAAIGLGLNTK